MTRQRLNQLLMAKEAELAAKLEATRSRFEQGGDRGDGAEAAIRDFLSQHLARSLDVGHGEIIDADGGRSRQTDVVITTDDHPFRQGIDEPGLFIAEAVLAAGEVKTRLTVDSIPDIVTKGEAMKVIARRHLDGSTVYSNPSDTARWLDGPLPFFAFAFESAVAPETLVSRLADTATGAVDAVFVLGKGAAVNFGDGQGAFKLVLLDGSVTSGWAWMRGQSTLLQMLAWINALPRVRHMQSPFNNYVHDAQERGTLDIIFPSPR